MLLSRALLPVADEPARAALIAMIYAAAAVFATLIFRPRFDASTLAILRWCLTVSALFAVIVSLDPVTRPALISLLRIAITVLLLSATVAIAMRRVPVPIAVAIFALLTLLPVWAAPAVELAGNPALFTNALVASSPLTLFATALDLDYLRGSWFYAHSSLGSMRYAYPGWLNVCLLLSVLPVAALLAEVRRPAAIPSIRFAKEVHP